jgi:hypothetical protein
MRFLQNIMELDLSTLLLATGENSLGESRLPARQEYQLQRPWSDHLGRIPERGAGFRSAIFEFCRSGTLTPRITKTYTFEDWHLVLKCVGRSEILGRHLDNRVTRT